MSLDNFLVKLLFLFKTSHMLILSRYQEKNDLISIAFLCTVKVINIYVTKVSKIPIHLYITNHKVYVTHIFIAMGV